MKVGILTFHRAHNCGAMLQNYALQTVLRRLGAEPETIDFNTIGEEHRFRKMRAPSIKGYIRNVLEFLFSLGSFDLRLWRFNSFRRRFIRTTCRMTASNLCKLDFDCYVVGSDQVFQPNLTAPLTEDFLLSSVKDGNKKYTYAASFGYPSLPVEFRDKYKAALSDFAGLSVRENTGKKIIKEELGVEKEVSVVVDPTLLLEEKDYWPLESRIRAPQAYVLVYSIGGADAALRRAARVIAGTLNIKVVFVNACRRHYMDVPFSDYISVSPDRLLYLMHHARFVVTTSFHGLAFSLIYHKPFLAIAPAVSKVTTRITELLSNMGLSGNLIMERDAGGVFDVGKLMDIDWRQVDARIDGLRASSMEYLKRMVVREGES